MGVFEKIDGETESHTCVSKTPKREKKKKKVDESVKWIRYMGTWLMLLLGHSFKEAQAFI